MTVCHADNSPIWIPASKMSNWCRKDWRVLLQIQILVIKCLFILIYNNFKLLFAAIFPTLGKSFLLKLMCISFQVFFFFSECLLLLTTSTSKWHKFYMSIFVQFWNINIWFYFEIEKIFPWHTLVIFFFIIIIIIIIIMWVSSTPKNWCWATQHDIQCGEGICMHHSRMCVKW